MPSPTTTFTARQTTISADWLNYVDAAVVERPRAFNLSAAPSTLGNHNSILTAFSGDIDGIAYPLRYEVYGAATLGQPTSGYLYTPERSPAYWYLYNESGYNHETAGNGGRTALAGFRMKLDQYGQGDMPAFNVSAFINKSRSGATHWLANPAASLINGDYSFGADGVGGYANPYEVIVNDNGYDVAAFGFVANFNRTNATGALGCLWVGASYQSIGTQPADTVIRAAGSWVTGIDFAQDGTSFSQGAAISLKSGQRIYFNNNANASGNMPAGWRTTGFNGDYIGHTTSGFTGLNFVQGGTSRLQVGTTVTVNTPFQVAIAYCNNYADETAAGAAGVPIGGFFRVGTAVHIRTV